MGKVGKSISIEIEHEMYLVRHPDINLSQEVRDMIDERMIHEED